MVWIKLIFRNIRRNKRRSLLTSLSLFFASFFVVLLHGYLKGTLKSIKEVVLNLNTGHIIIADSSYLTKRNLIPHEFYIENPDLIIEQIKNNKSVKSYKRLIKSWGAVVGEEMKPVLLMSDGENELVSVGEELANNLGIVEGDTLVILTKTIYEGITGMKVLVQKVKEFGFSQFDKNLILLPEDSLKKLIQLSTGVHEIQIILKNERNTSSFLSSLKLPEGVSARTYTEELGFIAFYFKFAESFYTVIYLIIIFLASFTIINTMTVAVFERLYEIGTLKAIGVRDNEIFLLFGFEGTTLGFIGGFLGGVLGMVANFYFHIRGIDFKNLAKVMDFPFPYVVRFEANLSVFSYVLILVTVVSFISASFPAFYARKLTPREILARI